MLNISASSNRRRKKTTAITARVVAVFLHKWIGLTAGLVFVISGLSGSVLAYSQPLENFFNPELAGPPPQGWQDARASVLERFAVIEGGAIRTARFPNAEQGVYELHYHDERVEYRDAISGDVVLESSASTRFIEFMRDLHIHLLAGHTGERVMGWIGVALLALILTGLWTWWPRRNVWRFVFRYPKSRRALPQLYWWHKTVGVIALPTLFFVTLTGVGMVFYLTAQSLLTSLFGGEPPAVPDVQETSESAYDWKAIVDSLDATLPNGRVVYFYFPENERSTVRARKKLPAELHPNGRSFIAMTRQGELLHATDATALDTGMRYTHAIYPLHSAKTDSETWRFIVALMGLVPLGFFVTGFMIWNRKRK